VESVLKPKNTLVPLKNAREASSHALRTEASAA
jgi:hypothetical protein